MTILFAVYYAIEIRRAKQIFKIYKYTLKPTSEEKLFFCKTFGCSRLLWNLMLADKQAYYKSTGESLYTKPSDYKTDYPFLKEIDSLALSNVWTNLNTAYSKFFSKKSKFPKFKSKKARQSYTTNNKRIGNYNSIRISNINDIFYIRLPKLKTPVKIIYHRSLPEGAIIKSATISKSKSGKYFISLLVETEVEKLPRIDKKVGVDLGLKDFAVLSDQIVIKNPKFFRRSRERIAKLQRKLSKKEPGSHRFEKARRKLAGAYERISNQRQDFLHKLSTKIIRENQTIVLEDLKVSNMLQNHKLALSIQEVSWFEFRQMIEYKANWYGRDIIIAPSDYPSSQLCSYCGARSKQTKDLSVRTYVCECCGAHLDRDWNAACNLEHLA